MDNDTRCLMFAAISFFSGLVIGLGTGLLLAPQSGTRTRRHLRTMMDDVGEMAGEFMDDAIDKVDDIVDRGKKVVG
ncbi:MAG: YtxH domain-containing protein [Nitrospirae bacterium]|nr:YtxH domain-containing protein [Nitrospirota bacterium]